MSQSFKNRVFGCVIIKANNANYNADFTGQPRTLPDGTVYATDKALKYTVRNYFTKNFADEKVFYFKSLNDEMQPRDLDQTYVKFFKEYPKPKGKDKKADVELIKPVLQNILSCLDIRLFGATYASQEKMPSDSKKKLNISLHGTTQFSHGVNRFEEGVIYSEQISSPFRNSNEKSADSMQTTLGSQFKLQEGHYVHHISVNPRNLEEMATSVESEGLLDSDIEKLKEALKNGATFYDSAAKTGVENELLFWVQLKEGSKQVLPSFVELISVYKTDNGGREVDFSKVKVLLEKESIKNEIEKIEVFYNSGLISLSNLPEGTSEHSLN